MAQAEFPFLLTKSLFNHRSVCKPRIVQTSNTQILNSARLHSGRARRAIVSVSTVQLIENAGERPNASREALAAVQNTLEAAGIEFLDGDAPGVRLHPKMPK
jgi:hypothetical protein